MTGGIFLIFVLLSVGIVSAGLIYYRNFERQYRFEVERQLSAIAELKTGDLVQWRKERLGDGAVFFNNTNFSDSVRRFFDNPKDTDAQHQIQEWASQYLATDQYDQIRLVDAQGVTRMALPANSPPLSSTISQRIPDALRSDQVIFQDFYRNDHDQRVYLSILVPLFDKSNGNRPLGVFVLRIDPVTYLYPHIRRWPISSRTAETLLVRRDGDDAVFLNELRFQTNTALNLRMAVTNITMPAVKAILGQTGNVEGRDYRGVPVIADVRPIPNSPWFLVSRMDTAEIYASGSARLWEIIVLIVLLFLVAGSIMGILWQQQSVRFYRDRSETDARSRRFATVVRDSNDAITIQDFEGRITAWNHGAELMYGYSEAEALAMSIERLTAPGKVDEQKDFVRQLIAGEAVTSLETQRVTKDGRILDVWMTVTKLVDEAGKPIGIASTERDITERKQSEEHIRKLNRVYAMLSNINKAIVRIREPHALFAETCRIAVENGGFRMAWIGLTDPTSGKVLPAGQAGVTDGYVEKLGITLKDDTRGCGPTGFAVRTSEPTICSDIENDTSMTSWREDALRNGYRSFATFPLKVRDEVRGILSLYAAEPRFFDVDELRLLDELAMDISFAMEFAEREAEHQREDEDLRRFATVVRDSNDAITIQDFDGRITAWNHGAELMYGYSEVEALLANIERLTTPAKVAEQKDFVRHLIAGEAINSFETQRVTKDGRILDVWMTVTKLVNKVGKPIGIASTERDITERKQAEQKLKESKALIEVIVENIPLMIILKEATDLRFVVFNRAGEELLGYDRKALLGKNNLDFFPPEQALNFMANDREVLDGEAGMLDIPEELIQTAKKGERLLHTRKVCIRGGDGTTKYLLSISEDITEHKRAEAERAQMQAQLIQSQKLESIDTLASGVAHEINNPIMGIMNYAQLILDRLGPDSPVSEFAIDIGKETERVATIVKNLLSFSRQEKECHCSPVRLHDIVEATLSLIRVVMRHDLVTLEVDVSVDLPQIKCRSQQIQQVIMNLLTNARDALNQRYPGHDENKKVIISARVIEEGERRHLRLTVEDHGLGIPGDLHERIFEPFFTTKPHDKGTGLGLSISHGIVKDHGGELRVESTVGEFTRFHLDLPLDNGWALDAKTT